MENWDDMRIFLAVARAGSGAGGARHLGLDQSTVSRRLKAFERRLGSRLFERKAEGQVLTLAGQRMLETAQRIDQDICELDRVIGGQDQLLSGLVRVAAADNLSNHLLLPVTSSFLQRFPQISLQIKTTDEISSLEKMAVDVALFATKGPPEHLIGRKLARAAFAIYGSHDYLAGRTTKDLTALDWINFDDGSPRPSWPPLAPEIPDSACRLRITSIASLLEATRQGVGVTILPCFMADPDPRLKRVTPSATVNHRDIWLMVQKDLQHSARVRVFLDHLLETLRPLKDLIEGKEPQE
ncbi:LysR family transcriptional regulator [Rhodovibrionaceae bacterium A322]